MKILYNPKTHRSQYPEFIFSNIEELFEKLDKRPNIAAHYNTYYMTEGTNEEREFNFLVPISKIEGRGHIEVWFENLNFWLSLSRIQQVKVFYGLEYLAKKEIDKAENFYKFSHVLKRIDDRLIVSTNESKLTFFDKHKDGESCREHSPIFVSFMGEHYYLIDLLDTLYADCNIPELIKHSFELSFED